MGVRRHGGNTALTTPSARTAQLARRLGYRVAFVELRLPLPALPGATAGPHRVTRDAFGLADLAMIHPLRFGTFYLQVTSGSNVAARIDKALSPELRPVLEDMLAGLNRFAVVGWAKQGARGARKLWTMRVIQFTLEAGARITLSTLDALP